MRETNRNITLQCIIYVVKYSHMERKKEMALKIVNGSMLYHYATNAVSNTPSVTRIQKL